jgi:hypothetical protein
MIEVYSTSKQAYEVVPSLKFSCILDHSIVQTLQSLGDLQAPVLLQDSIALDHSSRNCGHVDLV